MRSNRRTHDIACPIWLSHGRLKRTHFLPSLMVITKHAIAIHSAGKRINSDWRSLPCETQHTRHGLKKTKQILSILKPTSKFLKSRFSSKCYGPFGSEPACGTGNIQPILGGSALFQTHGPFIPRRTKMPINEALDILFAQPADNRAPLSSPTDGAYGGKPNDQEAISRLSSRQIATSRRRIGEDGLIKTTTAMQSTSSPIFAG